MNSYQNNFPLNEACVGVTEFGNFGNFQSRQVRKLIDTVVNMHDGDVTYQYRHFPNPNRKESLLAALALEAGKRQDQFLPMYDAMLTLPALTCNFLIAQALQLGFDQQQFMDDLADNDLHTVIRLDREAGHRLGVHNTPALFVDDYRFYGKFTLSQLVPFIHFHLMRKRKQLTLEPGSAHRQIADELLFRTNKQVKSLTYIA